MELLVKNGTRGQSPPKLILKARLLFTVDEIVEVDLANTKVEPEVERIICLVTELARRNNRSVPVMLFSRHFDLHRNRFLVLHYNL